MKPKNRIAILLFFFISLNLYSQETNKYSIFKYATYGYFEITDSNLNEVIESFSNSDSNFVTANELNLENLEIHFSSEGKYALVDKSNGKVLNKYNFYNSKIYDTRKILLFEKEHTAELSCYYQDKKKPQDKLSVLYIYGSPLITFHFLEKTGDKWFSYAYWCQPKFEE